VATPSPDPVRPKQVRRLVSLMRARKDAADANTGAPARAAAYRKAEALLAAAVRASTPDELAEAAQQFDG
jgi:hypothetical protein